MFPMPARNDWLSNTALILPRRSRSRRINSVCETGQASGPTAASAVSRCGKYSKRPKVRISSNRRLPSAKSKGSAGVFTRRSVPEQLSGHPEMNIKIAPIEADPDLLSPALDAGDGRAGESRREWPRDRLS